MDNLELVNEEKPKPAHGEVLIRIRALSLNFRDVLIANGQYPWDVAPNVIPVSDGAGEVVEVGEGVQNVKVGDRVMPNFVAKWKSGPLRDDHFASLLGGPINGVAAHYVVAEGSTLVHIPAHLSYEEASCLPCAAVTAWHALFEGPFPLCAGESVLIEGTGGVSIFGLQFAVAAGARVIITSSSNEKLQAAKALGAAELINYKEDTTWEQTVLKLTNNQGVNHVVEVGGADTVPKIVKCTTMGGNVHIIGGVSGYSNFGTTDILTKGLVIRGIFIGSALMFERMNAVISLHKIKPQIAKVFEFNQLREAIKYLESGSHLGKIVVRVD